MNNTNNTPQIIVKQIKFPVTTYQFLWVIWLGGLVLMGAYSAFGWEENQMQMCQKSFMKATNEIVQYNIDNPKYKIELPKYNCTLNLNATGGIAPEPPEIKEITKSPATMRDRFGLGKCRFVNSNHAIPTKKLKWMAYDIACEKGKSFDVKSPWYYQVVNKWYGANIWNYLVLQKLDELLENVTDTRIVLWHIESNWKVGDLIPQYAIIWKTNISWASTWIHIHIELWEWYKNVSSSYALWEPYEEIDGTNLLNNRKWDFGQPEVEQIKYYFTHYDLWDKAQNDSSPCIGASGKDLCYLERIGTRTMALTSDIRKSIGIKFGDTVELVWDKGCEWFYQVEDEMNERFRKTPWILRPWTNYYIKGDLPSMEWGACSIYKLNN